jgi:hypothetical protein
MRVLMAGGTGLIGRAFTKELVSAGHEVVLLTRRDAPTAPLGVTCVQWDGMVLPGGSRLIEDCDAVVNLAGQSIAGDNVASILFRRWTKAVKRDILGSRLRVGEALARGIEASTRKPAVLLQASAVGYYGADVRTPTDEQAPAGKDFLGRVCIAWEGTTARVQGLGVRRVVLRTGVVLSPAGGVLPMVALPFRLFAGGRLGDGRQPFPWIHLRDQVRAMRHLLEHETAEGPFNLVAPTLVTNSDLARALAAAMHRPNWLPVPGFALDALLGEKASLVLRGQAALPARLQAHGFTFEFPEISAALRDLLA